MWFLVIFCCCSPHNYYSYYYSYLIKYNQSAFNQLKQHQQNQTRFRVFQLNDVSLLVGFTLALFHLFSFGAAVQLLFVFSPVLFSLILFRLKSILNALLSLVAMFVALFYLSSLSASLTLASLANANNNPNSTSLYFTSPGSPLLSPHISAIVENPYHDDKCGILHLFSKI